MKINKFGEQKNLSIGTPVIVKYYSRVGRGQFKYTLIYYISDILGNDMYQVKTLAGNGGIEGVHISDIKVATKKEKINGLIGQLNHNEDRLKNLSKSMSAAFGIPDNIKKIKEILENE